MSTVPSAAHLQRLPLELTDAIIDHLHSDVVALGACSMVSSEWLKRSRHHIFTTVQLWPWRIHKFVKLAASQKCTFSDHIQRIELDDARVKPEVPGVSFTDAMSLSQLSRLSQVEAIQVRSVDWTALSPAEQGQLRTRLSRFRQLKRLEFDAVVFHDLREVVKIITSFPLLKHLSANVSFTKYTEHAIASAAQLRLPRNVETLELGTEDGIPVVLSSVLESATIADPHVTRLNLRNLKVDHLPLLRTTVRKIGNHLRHVCLDLDRDTWENVTEDDYIKSLKLSRLTQLRSLKIEGLKLSQKQSVLETSLPRLLSRLESPFLQHISISFSLDFFVDLDNFDWDQLQRVLKELHFFGMKGAKITINTAPTVDSGKQKVVEHWVRKALRELDERGALDVTVLAS
ncbi:hypothetical protein DFP72DRAFT_1122013 [Ephemerocybe angulata]|uniref:F-box domain-containing protein n=1 Tax=Ephemerocybe angulata TaxID=980116 RepID=A0A8H6HYL4_9AGAR|nr:hypothetical protein DFP72DRAFT_1122013 [Tulosesus angulatus]